MRIYLKQNVFDAALERLRWIFSEFPNVIVNISGGKDSTVVLNLALMVAEELDRLPLRVLFIDQEGEWDCVIDHIREVMADPRIDPYWVQCPIRLENATSEIQPWLYCWEDGAHWIREKEATSLHENVYGTDRFPKMFGAVLNYEYPDQKACTIAGVRTEESPGRLMGLTARSNVTYKGRTWGTREGHYPGHCGWYPIYDWSYTDVWKAIHDHDWPYCPLYDYFYMYGIPTHGMRVSNVHHGDAIKNLWFMQEIEPRTWDRLTARLRGVNTMKTLGAQWYVKELPFMFKTWKEYRDHLFEHLITDPHARERMRSLMAHHELHYEGKVYEQLMKTCCTMILCNDYHGTKLATFRGAHVNDWIKVEDREGVS